MIGQVSVQSLPTQPRPVGTRSVPFARTFVTDEAKAAVAEVLASGWLTSGPQVQQFEAHFAAYLGVRCAVAVSSCTAALEIALGGLRLPEGADVLTPSMTFCGAVNAIVHAGLHPVLVDIDAQTLVPRADQVDAAAARSRPAAMVVQHMAGYPAPVRELAAAAGLSVDDVVEDAAHALGTYLDDVPIGRVSRATCFSFYATKNLPMGEGGAVTTQDDDLAEYVRRVRLHGMSRDAWRRYAPGGGWAYSVDDAGVKANLSDVHAAIGVGHLPHLPLWQERRSVLAERYDRLLADITGLTLPPRPLAGTHAWHLYIVRITPEFGRDRNGVAAALSERGVGTSVHFTPVHRFPYFRLLLGEDACSRLDESDQAFSEVLSLPLYPGLDVDDLDYVAEQLRAIRS